MKLREGLVTIIPNTTVLLFSFVLKVHPYVGEQTDLFSIATATDIHNSKFDGPVNPIATRAQGVLDHSIAPAKYVFFVNSVDSAQLARFGLHDGMASTWRLLFLRAS